MHRYCRVRFSIRASCELVLAGLCLESYKSKQCEKTLLQEGAAQLGHMISLMTEA
jgi:hypothetical protein